MSKTAIQEVTTMIAGYHTRRDELKSLIDTASGREAEIRRQIAVEEDKLRALGFTPETAPAEITRLNLAIVDTCALLDTKFAEIDKLVATPGGK